MRVIAALCAVGALAVVVAPEAEARPYVREYRGGCCGPTYYHRPYYVRAYAPRYSISPRRVRQAPYYGPYHGYGRPYGCRSSYRPRGIYTNCNYKYPRGYYRWYRHGARGPLKWGRGTRY